MLVFVLDRSGVPLMPCSEKRARKLLAAARARVHRLVPFVIRLVDRRAHDCALQPLRIKLDPGGKSTGLALVRDTESVDATTGEIERGAVVLSLMALVHRGRQISQALTARRSMRRRRRGNLRYREPRFLNRTRRAGWLAPSLQHRVDTTLAWVARIARWAPVTAISAELVRFDMQALENPGISGIQYQQGTLAGYEVREYLLQKWGRQCAYCDATGVPLQIEHLHARARGGSNRISNLALANALKATGLSVELSSGGRTKYNRSQQGVPKTHALDAACVGRVNSVGAIKGWRRPTLQVKCTGRGSYQRTRLDKYGFARGYLMRSKAVRGFQTGDLVQADVPATSKKAGSYVGRVAVRASGNFNIQTGSDVVQGISHKHCRIIQRSDHYGYSYDYSRIATSKGDVGTGHVARAALSLPGLTPEVSRAIG